MDLLLFQSTPLREGRRQPMQTARLLLQFQSTPLREGRLCLGRDVPGKRSFNPRPCARGDCTPVFGGRLMRFNPRPCARGDVISVVSLECIRSFNPRPCARGDSSARKLSLTSTSFNPRPCARGDDYFTSCLPWPQFQSTPLREGRLLTLRVLTGCGRFNPRPCARGDKRWSAPTITPMSFNPRPCARGDCS